MRALDLTGQKFARLTAIRPVSSGAQGVRWACVCECGNKTEVVAKSIKGGLVQSCGCLNVEVISRKGKNSTHGLTKSPTYRTWLAMRQRCTYPKSISYRYYGAKGVTVCARWADSFDNFYADMGARPEGKTIDRIDGTKGYEPGNCRWATPLQQVHNRSNMKESR